MTLSRVALLVLTTLSLYACGGGESTDNSDADAVQAPGVDQSQPEQKPPTNIGEAMQRLEDTGAIPKLNRDSDVAGPDADRNGVRDDLDKFFNSLPDSGTQKNSLRQGGTSITNAMTVDLNNEELLQEAMDGITAAINCIYDRYDVKAARTRIKEIETYSVNTEERIIAYANYHHAISGRGTFLPKGDSCNE